MITTNAQFEEFITITPKELEILKSKYKACEEDGLFRFKNHELLKSYAKYLIQYLESQFEQLEEL